MLYPREPHDLKSTLERPFSLHRFPLLTVLLCALQLVIFWSVADGQRVLGLDTLIRAGAKVDANILELGQTWRLWTANLLHRDVLHLGFNTFFLFNVGGTVENAYRSADFLLILLGAALGTTVLSLVMSPVPSVGSSGVVLGLFGSASVFGLRYGPLLPRRYRRYFGAAVLPYALFILYVGLASPDTDNWGHVGGLLGGATTTLLLTPRVASKERTLSSTVSFAWACGLVALTLAAGPLVRMSALGLQLIRFEAPNTGLFVLRPARWNQGENHLGDPAWGNRLGVTLGLRAERRADGPFTLEGLASSFRDEVETLERSGELTNVQVISERPFFVDGGRAIEIEMHLESRAGSQVTRNILVERGYYGYRVVMSVPRPWSKAYASIFDRLSGGLRLIKTAELARARRVAQTFPGMSSAQVELGDALARVGEVEAAARAYRRALDSVPDLPEALYGVARLHLAYDGNLEAAERAASSLLEDRPEALPVVTLVSDLRKRLGRREGACKVLRTAVDRLEEPSSELQTRLAALRCTGGLWMERP